MAMSEVSEALNDTSPSHSMSGTPPAAVLSRKRKRSIAEKEDAASNRHFARTHKRIKQPSIPSAAFWDNLSKVPLTRRAIRELDRRTKQSVSYSSAFSCEYPAQLKNAAERFARRGGPDLSDLRGYKEPTKSESQGSMSRRQSSKSVSGTSSSGITKSSSATGSKAKRSSAYDAAFQQILVDHGVHPSGFNNKPANLTEIRDRIAQPRRSLSPSRFDTTAFENFLTAEQDAIDENEVMKYVLPIVCGESSIPHKENIKFTNLLSLTSNKTVNPQPDFYDGAKPGEIHAHVRNDLQTFIVPSNRTDLPAAPNFFLEAKGPKGALDVLQRQACLNGAVGARAMLMLQSYGQKTPVPDGNSYAISSTYGSGMLKVYATHPAPSAAPNTDFDYHMTMIGAWAIEGSDEVFRQGAQALRNAREWAAEHRNSFISSANEVAKSLDAKQLRQI